MSMNPDQPGLSRSPALGRLERFALVWKAKILLLVGLRERALDVFRDILRRSPQDVHALNSLGYDALQRANHEAAHAFFAQVLRITPQASNAQFNLAFVAELLGRLDEAEQGFRAALAIEEKWTGPGMAWRLCWCARGACLKRWWRSSATPPCSP